MIKTRCDPVGSSFQLGSVAHLLTMGLPLAEVRSHENLLFPLISNACHIARVTFSLTQCNVTCTFLADVAEKVLDRCTERKKYTFEFLEDFKPTPCHCCRKPKRNDVEQRLQDQNDHWGPKNFERSNHPLAIMVSHRNKDCVS